MGIKELWSILTPFCERKPLYELQGKVVAVDLSCWICEAQNISEYQVQPRMYLRNLYFRTCYLLLMEVIPIFVLEGKAPELKFQTIADRNAIQFKGARPKTDKTKTGKDRSRFHFVLKQCEEMLRYMGLACITGSGEAESMCAYLNEDGLVAGCISQDSDCFAYGARIVFRNFSISSQGSFAASGGAVDVYDIQRAKDSLKFGRNKIIALALLCGSDYNDGVYGVGKECAVKFMNKYDDNEILDRMRSWKKHSVKFDELENKIGDKNICTSCGHGGKVQAHTKSGCFECKTTKGCDFSRYREERLEIKNELTIRAKALADPNFPNEELINEYLIRKDNVKTLDLRWKQPNLVKFVKFTNKFLGWEEIYAFEKFLPILSRWQVLNYEYITMCIERNRLNEIRGILYPKYIKKKRNPKGVPSYEIIWNEQNEFFDHLIPDEQIEKYKEMNKDSVESLWSTIEPMNLVERAYPKLVEEFLETKNKKGKKQTKRKVKKKELDELYELLLETSISEPKPKKTRKKPSKKQAAIDEFINTNKENNVLEINKPKTKVDILKQETKKEALSTSFDLNASCFGDEDNLNISFIIDDIISQKPKLPAKFEKMGFFIQDLKNERKNDEDIQQPNEDANSGCDFDNLDTTEKRMENIFKQYYNENVDLLEKSLEEKIGELSDEDLKNFNNDIPNLYTSSIKKCSKFRTNTDFIEILPDEDSNQKKNSVRKKGKSKINFETPANISTFFGCNDVDLFEKSLQRKDSSSDDIDSPEKIPNLNESSFFETNYDGVDLFEQSMRKPNSSEDEKSDATIPYDLEDENIGNEFSFEECYVPLIDRIKAMQKT